MKGITILNNFNEKQGTILVLCIFFLLYVWELVQYGSHLVFFTGLMPFLLFFIYLCVDKPYILLGLFFIINYVIMGINRYYSIPIPITNVFDLLYGLLLLLITIRQLTKKDKFPNILNPYTIITLIWILYCIINIGNGITGNIQAEAWLKAIRPIALYPFLTCLIISVHCKHYSAIRYFLILWGICTLLAVAKGYWQRNHGFDSTELAWLWAYGARTHFIHSGIRYFSFFTDAANFGCSMGLSSVAYILSFFYVKQKKIKLFYLIVGLAAFYGLLISGTRAAIAVPIVGLTLFLFLSKNWKIGLISSIILIGGIGILKFTDIGDSNRLVRRMRTVFDSNDASLQVRFENQRALKAYMSEIPFGIGLGVINGTLSPQNKYYFVSICPPDSALVDLWIRTGVVGLTIFLVLHVILFTMGCYLLLFRIRSPEIRGPLTGMLCGCAGMLVASYANTIYFQFPNGILIYACFTFVFLGPYFDRQYITEHESAA